MIISLNQDGEIFGCQVVHTAHKKQGFSSIGQIKTNNFQFADGQVQGELTTDGQAEVFGETWEVNLKFVAPLGEIPKEFQVADSEKPEKDATDEPATTKPTTELSEKAALSPAEEARAYAVLLDEFGLALGEVAERVGRSKPTVSNRIRLLDLPDDVLAMLERGQLTEGHARAVLAVPDHDGRRKLAREIVQKGLSVRAAEQRAKWAGAKQKPRIRATPVDPALAARVRDALEHLTGFRAKVSSARVELAFEDEHELAELAEALERASSRL